MATKRAKLCFQRREDSTSGHHCCVPQCVSSARFNSVLSFHTFPKDPELQKRWMAKIKGQNLTISSHTRVCSRHFLSTDMIEPTNPDGRRRLKSGTVPELFHWNNFTVPSLPGTEDTNVCGTDTVQMDDRLIDIQYPDHDYCPSSEDKPSSLVSVTMDMDNMGPQSPDTDDSSDGSCTATVSSWKPEGKTNTRENGMSEQSVRRSCTVGCSNSSAKLQIWKQTQCDLQKLHDQSPSLRPHILHTFPERAQDQCVRQEWIKNINRDDFASKSNCKPVKSEFIEPITVNTSCVGSEVVTVKVEADCTKVKSESDLEDQAITPLAESSSQLGDDVGSKSPTEWCLRGELKKETNLKLSTRDQTVQTDIEQPQDCDEYYFMSLVKTFKKLAPEKKAQVRMKIERILFEAEFE